MVFEEGRAPERERERGEKEKKDGANILFINDMKGMCLPPLSLSCVSKNGRRDG